MLSTSNASYIDCFFYYLSSQLLHQQGFVHGCDFFGSFLGIQDKFRMNVEEDLEYLSGSSFFMSHIGKNITLEHYEHHPFMFYGGGSRSNKVRLTMEDTASVDIDFDSLEGSPSINIPTAKVDMGEELNIEYERDLCTQLNNLSDSDSDSSHSSVSVSEDYEKLEETDSSVSDMESQTSTESEDNPETMVYIDQFPVQMICLEKCQGTLDELFDQDKIDETRGIAFLFQVVMTLLMYQTSFGFTHNDLHTNNIMYVSTDQPYLWYKVDQQVYRVPTYGYIFKIIDFGRSIYHFQGKRFCSDSFSSGGDGSNQYNCEPYYNPQKPRIEPNYSFDLCRLGSSIYDFIIEDQYDETEFDQLQQLIFDWCTDDDGKNILYKGKNGRERYPGFKLYKMIARKVHRHTPENQLQRPCFQTFQMDSVDENTPLIHIKGTYGSL